VGHNPYKPSVVDTHLQVGPARRVGEGAVLWCIGACCWLQSVQARGLDAQPSPRVPPLPRPQLPTHRPPTLIEALEKTQGAVDPNQLWASRR
jgi:hypothetical protein